MIHKVLKPRTDYEQLQPHENQRGVSDEHVTRLSEKMQEVYLLDAYPVVLTKGGTTDGQHRVGAARENKVPVYAIEAETDIDVRDIALANSHTLGYRLEDALEVYSKMGLTPYKIFKDILDNHKGLPAATLAEWLSSGYNSPTFIEGSYIIDQLEYTKALTDHLREIVELEITVFDPRPERVRKIDRAKHYAQLGHTWPYRLKPYRDAFAHFIQLDSYNPDLMLTRIYGNREEIVGVDNVLGAKSILSKLYDKYRPNHTKVNLFSKKINPNKYLRSPIEVNRELPIRGVPYQREVTIHVEKDLAKFSLHPHARSPRQTDTLTDYMKDKNLLPYYPIIVDENLVIYDGQRRFEAAYNLGLPIYYIIVPDISMWMIVQAGGIAKSWRFVDYLDHYAKLGLGEYVLLKELKQAHPFIDYNAFLSLNGSPITNRHAFRRGQFVLKKELFRDFLWFIERVEHDVLKKRPRFQRFCTMILLPRLKTKEEREFMLTCINEEALDNLNDMMDSQAYLMRLQTLYNSKRLERALPIKRLVV